MRTLFHVAFIFSFVASFAQSGSAKFILISGEKASYNLGDTLQILAKAQLPPELCPDGMDKTRLFLSGFVEINRENWEKTSGNNFQKHVTLIVTDNKKGFSKLTLIRKADKGDFFTQLKIAVHDNRDN